MLHDRSLGNIDLHPRRFLLRQVDAALSDHFTLEGDG